MSAQYYVYVGPYLRCSAMLPARTEEVILCGKNQKHHQGNDPNIKKKFCPECGTPTEKKTVEHPAKKATIDEQNVEVILEEDTLHRFNAEYEKDVALFVPDDEGLRRFTFANTCTNSCGELADLYSNGGQTIKDEIEWFESTLNDEITAFKRVYGADSVQVRWGVLGELN